MKIGIVSPAAKDALEEGISGNSITAARWAGIFRHLGHEVFIAPEWQYEAVDMLIALHARRSHLSVERFRRAHPARPLIVALTGTDVYNDLSNSTEAQDSLRLADRLIVLQDAALEMLVNSVRSKARVIYQSAVPPAPPDVRPNVAADRFDVCVLSHLRDVKDPLRAAWASRLLPPISRIRIVHAGKILDSEYEALAKREELENSRYRWLGPQSHQAALQLLASCRLFVLSSAMEGGANAIAEAVVCEVPILCSRISGNIGMLGADYPGYFPFGDTDQLAQMLYRAELDPAFLSSLVAAAANLQSRFSPQQELEDWHHLLKGI